MNPQLARAPGFRENTGYLASGSVDTSDTFSRVYRKGENLSVKHVQVHGTTNFA